MNFSLSEFKWRLLSVLLVFQALAVMETERGYVVDAFHFRIRRPYSYYRGRPMAVVHRQPYWNSIKRPAHPDEEYQYGPDEIPYIYYS